MNNSMYNIVNYNQIIYNSSNWRYIGVLFFSILVTFAITFLLVNYFKVPDYKSSEVIESAMYARTNNGKSYVYGIKSQVYLSQLKQPLYCGVQCKLNGFYMTTSYVTHTNCDICLLLNSITPFSEKKETYYDSYSGSKHVQCKYFLLVLLNCFFLFFLSNTTS